jgi:sulfatase maturation enzyme AslB (radical SAM superfamily)
MIKQHKPELTLDQWKEAFRIVFEDLGGDFVALYGGEPLMLRDKLVDIVEYLSTFRSKGKDFTVISNCIGLERSFMQRLMEAGLQSWTASVDGFAVSDYYDSNSQQKSGIGYRKLREFKDMGLRDCCGIFTITKKNIRDLPAVITELSREGIWTGFDFVHYDKGNDFVGHSRFNATRAEIGEDVLFSLKNSEDREIITSVMNEVARLKREGAMVFPSFEAIEKLSNPWVSAGLTWNCKYPASITIDCDGSLGGCDDYPGKNIEKWSIFDLAGRARWAEFVEVYKRDVENCYGCAWSTHILACQFVDEQGNLLSDKAREYYQHKACGGEF